MDDTDRISDQLLKRMQVDIMKALDDKKLSPAKVSRLLLESNGVILLYITNERKRTRENEKDIASLKRLNLFLWVKENRVLSLIMASALLIVMDLKGAEAFFGWLLRLVGMGW